VLPSCSARGVPNGHAEEMDFSNAKAAQRWANTEQWRRRAPRHGASAYAVEPFQGRFFQRMSSRLALA
jgi:hypothetical protein